jgi:hypothetical protein
MQLFLIIWLIFAKCSVAARFVWNMENALQAEHLELNELSV